MKRRLPSLVCTFAITLIASPAFEMSAAEPAVKVRNDAPLIVNEDNDHFFKLDKSLMTVEVGQKGQSILIQHC